MEIEEGMYVRYISGFDNDKPIVKIGKVIEVLEYVIALDNFRGGCFSKSEFLKLCMVGKPSYDIMELIEPGDYVNGSKVIKTNCKLEYIDDDSDTGVNEVDDGLELEKGWIYFDYEIKTVLTKEQYEYVMYEVKHD